jgi:hypothetical protein
MAGTGTDQTALMLAALHGGLTDLAAYIARAEPR